jgi:hypothetical protein
MLLRSSGRAAAAAVSAALAPLSSSCAGSAAPSAAHLRALVFVGTTTAARASASAASSAAGVRAFHTSRAALSMDEFFPKPVKDGQVPQLAGAFFCGRARERVSLVVFRRAHSPLSLARAPLTRAPLSPLPPPFPGRAWTAAELRRKAWPDLHGLWFVCLKERNLLLTERLYFRQVGQAAPDPSRLHKVRRTMAMIKVVIGERARAAAMLEADKERAERVKSVGGAVVAALTGEGELEGGAAAAAGAAAPAASTPAPSGSVSLDVAKKNAQKAVKARLQSKVR